MYLFIYFYLDLDLDLYMSIVRLRFRYRYLSICNYLDVHMPDVHQKRGTHIWFNTPKAGGIKVGFFCRDKDFIEDAIKRNSETIETYSNGIRIIGHPIFQKSEEAVEAACRFIKNMIK